MRSPRRSPRPPRLGVHPTADGITVAVLASHAEAVDLCLLDPDPTSDDGWTERRVPLDGPVHGIWSADVAGVRPGQRYGFRAHGAWDPTSGLRYNPAKLLLDPYARGITGDLDLRPAVYGHVVDETGRTVGQGPRRCSLDSRASVPHGVVLDAPPASPADTRPYTPWPDTVVYEAHVRGLTRRLPQVPPPLRGTYAGLAHPATIEHLRSLGVTTIELLPIHASASEPHLLPRGLSNYWGYNTLSFFAPEPAYATATARSEGPQAVLDEVVAMVRTLHEAGLEVLLDVVYNHTCEGGTDGPQLSWRGLDPTVYYMHDGSTPARFADVTGCGNTLDFRRPRVVQLALDSLRYWAEVVGVDGFRFDLAVTLGRDGSGYTPNHPFLVALQTDPTLSGLKLIAEPWDLGPGGWRTGEFPAPMAEWNDRFRNAVRGFWLADPAAAAHGRPGHGVRDLATRLAGSVDLFGYSDPPLTRGPVASVNYVTAHDGFTLADLVTYEHKRNIANGESNRDGTNDNRSWNHGFEGPVGTADIGAEVLPLRRRSMRNLLGTLLFSAGTPMITAGDELGRTQRGNNNAYSQDNELSWVDWQLDEDRSNMLATARYLLALRRELPAMRTDRFYLGAPEPARAAAGDTRPDLDWRTAGGDRLTHALWHDPAVRCLQMIRTATGSPAVLVVINGTLDPVEVTLPELPGSGTWHLRWDSVAEHPDAVGGGSNKASGPDSTECAPGTTVVVDPLSLWLFSG